jgi:hypothetical protein
VPSIIKRGKSGLPKYCSWNKDQSGFRSVRFRRNGIDVCLTGAPFSDAFLRQYWAAMEGRRPDRFAVPSPARVIAGSMNDLSQAYMRSPSFKGLKPSTQTARRNIIVAFCKEHGDKPVKMLARRHVADIIGAKADTPMAANNLLKVLRYLLDHAVERDMIPANPATNYIEARAKGITHGPRTRSQPLKPNIRLAHAHG